MKTCLNPECQTKQTPDNTTTSNMRYWSAGYCSELCWSNLKTANEARTALEKQIQDKFTEPQTSFDVQIGGNHYASMVIQPTEFIMKNKLNYIQGNVIKYICRYKNKNGREDLEKVKHYVDLLIDLEYGDE